MQNRRTFGGVLGVLAVIIIAAIGCAGVEAQKRYDAGLQNFQKTKDYDQAIKELNEAIKLDPKDAKAYNLLGWSYVKKGKLDLAFPHFQKAVELDPKNISALGGLGLYYYTFAKDKEAIETAQKTMTLTNKVIQSEDFIYYDAEGKKFFNDFQGDSYAIIGMASHRLGKFEDAIRYLENALKKPASWADPKDLRLHLGQSLQAAKKFDQALEEYSGILSMDPKSVGALAGRGWLYLQQSKPDEAEKDFFSVLQIQPQHASAAAGLVEVRKDRSTKTQEAWDLLAKKEYDGAISAFQKALGRHPQWSIIYDGLGWSYYWKGMMPEAEEAFAKALRLDAWLPTSITGKAWVAEWRFAPLNAAWALLDNQQYDEAINAFHEILQDKSGRLPSPERWRLYNGLGWAFYGKKDFRQAEVSFQEGGRQFPKNADSWKGLGFTYYAAKQFDAAIQELTQALSKNGAQADVQTMIGWAYYQKKDYAKAREAYEKVLGIYPSWADAYAGLGFSFHALGEKEKALASFRKAIWLSPRHLSIGEFPEILDREKSYEPLYADWGWAYFHGWMFAEAEERFTSALKKFPDQADLLRGLGYAQYRLKKFDPTIVNLEKSWELNPNLEPVKEYVSILNTPGTYLVQSDAQSRSAWSYYFKGNYDKAMAIFREVVARQPNWPNPRAGLGWCLFMKGTYGEAEKEFREAQKVDPNYPDSHSGLSAVAKALGQNKKP